MRDHIRKLINEARRSGDRIDVENKQDNITQLSADVIRLARLATSVHLYESARLRAETGSAPGWAPGWEPHRLSSLREIAQ